MSRRPLVLLVVVVSLAACTASTSTAPTSDELQGVLAQQDIAFTTIRERDAASSRGDVVDRASRGSGISSRLATWIYSGELTAEGNQGQTLIDQPVWAVYFSGFEQPMLGPSGGIAVSDWVVFVDTATATVVLSVRVDLTTRSALQTVHRLM